MAPDAQQQPFEGDSDDLRAFGRAALDRLVGFIEGLEEAPAVDVEVGAELAAQLSSPPPARGQNAEEVLDLVLEAASKAVDTANPGFLAYIPGGGLFTAAVAALLGAGTNRFVPIADIAPAFARIEATVIRWMSDLFGYPSGARGVLTSGGSIANLAAIVTAREAHLLEEQRGIVYTSAFTHHSVHKAARIARVDVRVVGGPADVKMDPVALASAIEKDKASGLQPFCVIASAGTTDTGGVDPLAEIVDIAREQDVWAHVDAAYGGFFQLTARGAGTLTGIGSADSITLDPHKGMFLPYGVGCLLVREGERLREAHAGRGSYMQDQARDEADLPSSAHYGPELSRDFRGLRVWLPLQLHGTDAFRDALDEKLDLAWYVYEELVGTRGFEVPWEPELSTVVFRYRPEAGDVDAFNRRLLERINASKRVFLSSTTVSETYMLRVCILSHRTHADRIREGVDIIKRAAAELEE